MVDCDVVYRGSGRELRQFPAVPRCGDYLHGPGCEPRLWRVAEVLWGGVAVACFCIEVSEEVAAEIERGWQQWGEPAGGE